MIRAFGRACGMGAGAPAKPSWCRDAHEDRPRDQFNAAIKCFRGPGVPNAGGAGRRDGDRSLRGRLGSRGWLPELPPGSRRRFLGRYRGQSGRASGSLSDTRGGPQGVAAIAGDGGRPGEAARGGVGVLPASVQNLWQDRGDGEMERLRGPGGRGRQTKSAGAGGNVHQDGNRDVAEVASASR